MSQADKGQLWKHIASDRVIEVARVHGTCVAYTWIDKEFAVLQVGMTTLTEFYKFYEEYEAEESGYTGGYDYNWGVEE